METNGFRSIRKLTLYLAKLYHMKQDKDESIKKYIENVKSSLRILKLKEEEVIEIITGGIRDEFGRIIFF
jgi:DNA topoisomerase VI subunit B